VSQLKIEGRVIMLRSDIPSKLEAQLVNWVAGLVQSNNDLVNVLGRLRDCYAIALAGEQSTDSNDILAKVEIALRDAEKTRKFV
jgi:hypothetical protein